MEAYLHRRGKPLWVFEWCEIEGNFIHTTRYKKTYAILADHFKPFWVGLCVTQGNKDIWVTVESELKADYIEFENGGKYYFPR